MYSNSMWASKKNKEKEDRSHLADRGRQVLGGLGANFGLSRSEEEKKAEEEARKRKAEEVPGGHNPFTVAGRATAFATEDFSEVQSRFRKVKKSMVEESAQAKFGNMTLPPQRPNVQVTER